MAEDVNVMYIFVILKMHVSDIENFSLSSVIIKYIESISRVVQY